MKTIWKKNLILVWFIILSATLTSSIQMPYASAKDTVESKTVAERRVDTGIFSAKTYHPDSDSYSMTILTSDGNEWEIDNYVHKLHEALIVVFDTNQTEEVTDDRIVRITINSVFD